MSENELVDLFRTRLGAVQTSSEVERFTAEVYRSNHALLRSALLSVHATAAKAGPPRNARAAVQAAYDERLAEISQMFPLFFIFESAYRAFAAARLRTVYGDDLWWEPIRRAARSSLDPRVITSLAGRAAKRDVVDAVAHLLGSLRQSDLLALRGTYDLLEAGTLAHVGRLIAAHWSDISPVLSFGGAPALTSSNFSDQFAKVRNARNDAYHHRLVRDRLRVVAAAERLLHLLEINLADRLNELRKVSLPALRPPITTTPPRR